LTDLKYDLHPELEKRIVEQIYESISYRLELEEFTNEVYERQALNACVEHLQQSMEDGASLKDISYRIENRPPENAEIMARNAEIEMDSNELARIYKQAYDEASVEKDDIERTEHEKAVHLLIEQSLESNTFEKDYDAVFSETFFKDHAYESKKEEYPDLNMNKHREMDEREGSDADFWRVNLEDQQIDLVEVKTSEESNKSRAERQLQDFENAVNHANEQAGTDFEVTTDFRIAGDMLEAMDEPGFFEGDYQLAEDIEPEDLAQLEQFVDELLFGVDMQEADQFEQVSPEKYVEA
jgi:hypothetical protein